jgi:site-specific DNA recombinase
MAYNLSCTNRGKTLRAAIYARVSTDEQAEKQTIKNQLTACRDYCERQGYEVVGEFLDDGVSGTVPFADRAGGAQLIALADKREIDVVVSYRLDRFGRDAIVCLIAIERLKPRVTLEWVDERFDDSPSGQFAQTVMAGVAQLERALIRQRTMAGRERRVASGRYQASAAPFGYTYNRETGQLEVDPETAPVVRQIFEWSRAGLGTKAIAHRLDEQGVPPPMLNHPKRKGTYPVWNFSTIYKMLTAPRYTGENTYGKQRMTCPAIIDVETFAAVQEAMPRRKRDAFRNTKSQYLLQKLIYCGACGSRYTANSNRNGRTYACYHRFTFGKQAGHQDVKWRWDADELEGIVSAEITRILEGPEAALASFQIDVEEYKAGLEETGREVDRAEQQIAEAEQQRERVVSAYTRGLINDADLAKQVKQIEADVEEAREIVKWNRGISSKNKALMESAEWFIDWVNSQARERTARDLASADFDERREIVQRLFDKITVQPDGSLRFEGRVNSVLTSSR